MRQDDELVGWRYEPIVAKTAAIHHGPRGVRAPHQMALPAKHKRSLLPFSRFAADGTTEPAHCNTGRYLLSSMDQVGHLVEPHETPHPACECGYRVVASLTQLTTYMRRQERQLRGRPDLRITHLVPGGIYQVRAVGPVLSSGAAFDDPPGSVRAAGLQMTGLVFLPENGIGRAARRALARFDLPMDVRMVPSVLALRDVDAPTPAHR